MFHLRATHGQSSSPAIGRNIGFAIDIDGVIHNKGYVLPNVRDTMNLMQLENIPFIFVTNAGGRTEQERAEYIGQMLDLVFNPYEFVQCHTPWLDLLPTYSDKNVLVIGGRLGNGIRGIAQAYGFKNAITTADLIVAYQDIYPDFGYLQFARYRQYAKPLPRHLKRIHAILVFGEPQDWYLCSLLINDLLLSSKGRIGTRSPFNGRTDLPNRGYLQDDQPALHWCNPRLVPASSDPKSKQHQPGFRAAAVRALSSLRPSYVQARPYLWENLTPQLEDFTFQIAVEEVFSSLTGGAKMNTIFIGKPTQATFEYAESRLCEILEGFKSNIKLLNPDFHPDKPLEIIYMIGDNPKTDIQGANSFRSQRGIEWKSVLVETGNYETGTIPEYPPRAILPGIAEAVDWAMNDAKNGGSPKQSSDPATTRHT